MMSDNGKLTIKHWAEEDRPREKMLKNGLSILSDAELIAIIIGSGNANESAVELARRMLVFFDNNLDQLGKASVDKLKNQFKGIGEAKAINILAALELGKRRQLVRKPARAAITSSYDAWELFGADLAHLPHEEFWVLFLDRSNKPIDKVKVSQGGVSGTLFDVRLVLKPAIEKLASTIILVHNHPSGNLNPSQADQQVTTKIAQAALLMDMKVVDHLIIAGESFFSFADQGLI